MVLNRARHCATSDCCLLQHLLSSSPLGDKSEGALCELHSLSREFMPRCASIRAPLVAPCFARRLWETAPIYHRAHNFRYCPLPLLVLSEMPSFVALQNPPFWLFFPTIFLTSCRPPRSPPLLPLSKYSIASLSLYPLISTARGGDDSSLLLVLAQKQED